MKGPGGAERLGPEIRLRISLPGPVASPGIWECLRHVPKGTS